MPQTWLCPHRHPHRHTFQLLCTNSSAATHAPSPGRSLVRDLAGFKRRVEADSQDVEACFALVQLLQAVTGSVSVLRERKHDALLAEVLGIRMWLVRRVSGRRRVGGLEGGGGSVSDGARTCQVHWGAVCPCCKQRYLLSAGLLV